MRRRIKKKNNKNLNRFFIYTVCSVSVSLLLIGFLTMKNERARLQNKIVELKKSKIKNTSIVKELQGEKEYYSSEKYISNTLKNIMVVVVPEPEIITISNE